MANPREQIRAIEGLQKEIAEIYAEKDLKSISGTRLDFMIGDRQVLTWFFNVVRKGQIKFQGINFHEVFDDIIFCSDEILYHTALLYLYAPYMNNPIEEGYLLGDRMTYPNRQNLAAKRFGMHSNSAFEKVYNFWDRIGDLIAVYLPTAFPPGRKVFFGSAVDAIPNQYHRSENYQWIKQFKDVEYKAANEKRINVVHHLTNETLFKYKHLEASSDRNVLEQLIHERNSLPTFFKQHIDLTLEGFVKTILLLEEITDNELTEIE